jgi:hypothetical protein
MESRYLLTTAQILHRQPNVITQPKPKWFRELIAKFKRMTYKRAFIGV